MATDRDKKRHLAHSYYTDSRQFLHRAETCLATPFAQRFSYRGKIATDLVMSIECALKSLLATHAPQAESAKDVFGRLLRFSHHIQKLAEGVLAAGVQISPAVQTQLPNIYRLSVSLRYALDTFTELVHGQRIPPKLDFSTPEGMQNLQRMAEEMCALSKTQMEREFSELVVLNDSHELDAWFQDLADLTAKA